MILRRREVVLAPPMQIAARSRSVTRHALRIRSQLNSRFNGLRVTSMLRVSADLTGPSTCDIQALESLRIPVLRRQSHPFLSFDNTQILRRRP